MHRQCHLACFRAYLYIFVDTVLGSLVILYEKNSTKLVFKVHVLYKTYLYVTDPSLTSLKSVLPQSVDLSQKRVVSLTLFVVL